FAFGVFFTTPVFSIFFMNLPVEGDALDFGAFFSAKGKQHLLGIFAGIVWLTGILAAMVVGSVPEQIQGSPLLRYMLGNCWPLLAALWGMLVFREFKGADIRVKIMGVLMMVLYICGA